VSNSGLEEPEHGGCSYNNSNCELTEDRILEDTWELIYSQHQAKSMQKNCLSTGNHSGMVAIDSRRMFKPSIRDGSTFQDVNQFPQKQPFEVRFTNDISAMNLEQPVDLEELIESWSLNPEQALTFKIIANQSLQAPGNPLCMFLGGAAGTRKS
jgi:hypothetical protein